MLVPTVVSGFKGSAQHLRGPDPLHQTVTDALLKDEAVSFPWVSNRHLLCGEAGENDGLV